MGVSARIRADGFGAGKIVETRGLVQHSRGGHLGEKRLGGKGTNERRMGLGYGPGVGEPETEVLQNPPDDLGILS